MMYLDVSGQATYGIAICGRCSRKFLLAELSPDPNSPGLMVCKEDLDDYDPYRLAARQPESINLQFPRPDANLATYSGQPSDYTWSLVGGTTS